MEEEQRKRDYERLQGLEASQAELAAKFQQQQEQIDSLSQQSQVQMLLLSTIDKKGLLWETLMEHFTLPDHFTDADVEKVKDAALRKMAIAFTTTRIVNGTSTSREEGRLQYSREH